MVAVTVAAAVPAVVATIVIAAVVASVHPALIWKAVNLLFRSQYARERLRWSPLSGWARQARSRRATLPPDGLGTRRPARASPRSGSRAGRRGGSRPGAGTSVRGAGRAHPGRGRRARAPVP